MRLVASILALSLTSCAIASAETYVVSPDGSGDFPTIQTAIDAVVDGDIVQLTDGVFTGEGNRDLSVSDLAKDQARSSGLSLLRTAMWQATTAVLASSVLMTPPRLSAIASLTGTHPAVERAEPSSPFSHPLW
jgi:hypothetical protein